MLTDDSEQLQDAVDIVIVLGDKRTTSSDRMGDKRTTSSDSIGGQEDHLK